MTDLKRPCRHGRYDEHVISALNPRADCPGGSLLPPEQIIIIEKIDGRWPEGEWPEWVQGIISEMNAYMAAVTSNRFSGNYEAFLDALAAAQPEQP